MRNSIKIKDFKVIMVISIFILLLTLPTYSSFNDDSFDKGWKEGYCEGWKDKKGQMSVCPIAPIAPIPDIDCTTYKCGYNKGFKAGKNAAKEK